MPSEPIPPIERRCPECGAPLGPGQSCRDLFERMLIIETDVTGGPGGLPHFYAVGTYQLQHPNRYRSETMVQLWITVEDALAGRVQLHEILSRMRQRFGGKATVMRKGPGPDRNVALGAWPHQWPMTVADICAVGAPYYVEMVERWASTAAEAIRECRRGA